MVGPGTSVMEWSRDIMCEGQASGPGSGHRAARVTCLLNGGHDGSPVSHRHDPDDSREAGRVLLELTPAHKARVQHVNAWMHAFVCVCSCLCACVSVCVLCAL